MALLKPIVAAIAIATILFTLNTNAKETTLDSPIAANQEAAIGLYSAQDLSLTTGKCEDCSTSKQAIWYFEKELIAVPNSAITKAGLHTSQPNAPLKASPSLVWMGSSEVIPQAEIKPTAKGLGEFGNLEGGGTFSIVNKIPTNLSYWNDSTLTFFKQRPIRLRGEMTDRGFVARTIWPLDYKIPKSAELKPLQKNESLQSLVQFEKGGAKSVYEARLLWAKNDQAKQISAGNAIIAFMLNGAQGDDDEAHGGHFAVVTGRMEADGNYSRWMVNNFYNLASYSEKGIIAAATPFDNYMADLNSGQSYYRPSYMLVAVLNSEAIPAQFQTATNEIYEHFYRNEFLYDHSRENCAGISIDTLRKLGWIIPERGVENHIKAIGAYFYVAATEKSLTKGRAIYDYLTTEKTRLLPAVTFNAIGSSLLNGAGQWSRQLYDDHHPTTSFMRQLGGDVEAIYFVRIPQIPSSRVFGLAPVYSFEQYMQEAPADKSQWKIVPTKPRQLPKELLSGTALKQQIENKPYLVPWPVGLVMLLVLMAFGVIVREIIRRKQRKNN